MLGKLIGGVMVVGATSYAGWQIGAGYARRPAQLRDAETALAVLQTEVEYGANPLPEALGAAARAAGGPVGLLFAATAERLVAGGGITPGEALRHAFTEGIGTTALRPEDLEVVLALAEVLGASGRADQMRHLALARERLRALETRATAERAKYERLARYMGVLSGVALVLILL